MFSNFPLFEAVHLPNGVWEREPISVQSILLSMRHAVPTPSFPSAPLSWQPSEAFIPNLIVVADTVNLKSSSMSNAGWTRGMQEESRGMDMNLDHSVIFEVVPKCYISDSFTDYEGYSISSMGFLPTEVDKMVI